MSSPASWLLVAAGYGLTLLVPALIAAEGGSELDAGWIYWCGALGAVTALLLSGRFTQRVGALSGSALGGLLYAMGLGVIAGSSSTRGYVDIAGLPRP